MTFHVRKRNFDMISVKIMGWNLSGGAQIKMYLSLNLCPLFADPDSHGLGLLNTTRKVRKQIQLPSE